jgi:DNA-directed RNA polymerase subunit RPC12/RpoP
MPWFRNYYRCARCGHEWSDEWTATCDDDCPRCGARHMSPYKSEDLPTREGYADE